MREGGGKYDEYAYYETWRDKALEIEQGMRQRQVGERKSEIEALERRVAAIGAILRRRRKGGEGDGDAHRD